MRKLSNTTDLNGLTAFENGCGDVQSLCIVRLVASGWIQKEPWAVARIGKNQIDDLASPANPETLSLRCKLIVLALAILWIEGTAILGQAIASLRTRLYRQAKLRSRS